MVEVPDSLAALANLADDQADFLGRTGRALGQVAHLVGDHGKTTPIITGPRRLDRRIQRQQVGLAGDRLNHLGDLGDLLGTVAQTGHLHAAGLGAGL